MREIKFRAKYPDGVDWLYGGGVWIFHSGATVMFGEDSRGLPVVHSVNAETVGQFTGLLDKNGRAVFEGDVIEGNLFDRRLPTRGEVVYAAEHCAFANRNLAGDTLLFKIAELEVIGNIHSNPELLEK